MITNKEKEQIHNELLPFWLFYQVEHEVNDLAYAELVTNFKDTESYKIYIKRFIRINETLFFKHIVLLDRGAFIVEINDQFNNYNIKCLDMNDWLKSTYKLIVNGLPSSKINLQSKSEFLEWYKIKIDLLEKTKLISSNNEPEVIDLSNTKTKDYKKTIWFKTGIPLATGKAFDLYRKYKKDKGHFTKICLELGFKDSDRTYFSSTINDNVTDKNTFTNKDKLQKLHKYLTENNLPFGVEFLKKHNEIEPD